MYIYIYLHLFFYLGINGLTKHFLNMFLSNIKVQTYIVANIASSTRKLKIRPLPRPSLESL